MTTGTSLLSTSFQPHSSGYYALVGTRLLDSGLSSCDTLKRRLLVGVSMEYQLYGIAKFLLNGQTIRSSCRVYSMFLLVFKFLHLLVVTFRRICINSRIRATYLLFFLKSTRNNNNLVLRQPRPWRFDVLWLIHASGR